MIIEYLKERSKPSSRTTPSTCVMTEYLKQRSKSGSSNSYGTTPISSIAYIQLQRSTQEGQRESSRNEPRPVSEIKLWAIHANRVPPRHTREGSSKEPGPHRNQETKKTSVTYECYCPFTAKNGTRENSTRNPKQRAVHATRDLL